MTQQVPTQGFVAPPQGTPPVQNPAPQGSPIPFPAQGAQPAPAAPASEPTASPAPQGDAGLAAAIAALTAAMKGGEAPKPAEAPGVPADVGSGEVPDLNTLDVQGLEDPLLRSMAVALQSGAPAGLDMNRVLGIALERGDPSLIDRAYLIEKCGKDAAHRIQIAEGIVASVNAKAASTAESVYAAAGGKEQWGAAAAAFNTGAPEALKAVVVNMLDSGNAEYVKHASTLVVEFAKGQGLIPNSNPLLSAGAGPTSGQALDKVEFQTELRKLDPNARDYQEQRGALFARRQLGKQLGK